MKNIRKKSTYIWQQKDWPAFTWDSEALLPALSRARKRQGQVMARASLIGLETKAEFIIDEALTTSAIEGEKLDRNSVRSSIARRLGIPAAGLAIQQRSVEGLVDILLDATHSWQDELTVERIQGWHAALFPTGYSGIHKIAVGRWRVGDEPMRVISGRMGREILHYEAPPSAAVPGEITNFLRWWGDSAEKIDGLIRAGLAHFYFVTIHPFDDGNGRMARALTDRALAQDEKIGIRLYSVSSQIVKNRDAYYHILESSQKQGCDITPWLQWFLELLGNAMADAEGVIQKTLHVGEFWQTHSQITLNERQRKVIQRLLEAEPLGFEGGLTNRKYVGLTKTSRETAKRDLADLEAKGVLKRNPGQGRSISYSLAKMPP